MTEFYTGNLLLIAMIAITLVAVILLIVLLATQREAVKAAQRLSRESEQTLTDYMEGLVKDTEGHLSQQVNQQQATLFAWHERIDTRLDASLRTQDSRLNHLGEVLNTRLGQNDQKVGEMRETLFTSLTQMRTDNAAKLEEMRKTVDEHLHQTLNRRLGESFTLVNERLEAVYKGLGEMKNLASGVGDLKKVLTNIKTRGTWGETQLSMLLQEALAPQQYETNCAVVPGSNERVEFAVKLPGQEEGQAVYLPIDAKFPLEDYERLQAAQDAADKPALDNAAAALERAILREADRIASKYIKPPYTTDFAILYLPVEGLYAEALRIAGLAERLQRQHRVSLAGPTTLLALLNSLQMGFRTLAIQHRSAEVWRLLSQVKADFTTFSDILDKTQNRLRQASESIDLANRRTRSITRRLQAVESLDTPSAMDEEQAAQRLLMDDIDG
ncbi:MAG: DNA recombination protein RmuC [Clostridiales bacterium]|nr:DNA recombination protein RmuC [Clostridiales bacterium]